jgi:hypothetical protein
MSNSKKEFFDNLVTLSPTDIKEIEELTRVRIPTQPGTIFVRGLSPHQKATK